MSREVFIAGQILTAAEMNIVSDQTVMSFAGTASRGSAIASPVEGMTTYIEDSNSVQIYDGSAWKRVLNTTGSILQVVSTTKTDTFTSSSASFVDITGLSAAITPSSTTSKVMVLFSVQSSSPGQQVFRITRAGSAIGIADTAGLRQRGSTSNFQSDGNVLESSSNVFLDSPSSTSALTYQIQIYVESGTTGHVNRDTTNTDSAQRARTVSSITLMEVAG